jgi:hypothetical protein
MLRILQEMPDNVVAFVVSGKITVKDFDDVLIPAVESSLKRHGEIRVLYQMSNNFSGIAAKAKYDDARLGKHRRAAFVKIAVVTDVYWITDATQFLSIFLPYPVKIFQNNSVSEAKTWLTG